MAEIKLGQVLPLDKIIAEEEVVFLDSGFNDGHISLGLDYVQEFTDFDLGNLLEMKENSHDSLRIWSASNTFTTVKVMFELGIKYTRLHDVFPLLKRNERQNRRNGRQSGSLKMIQNYAASYLYKTSCSIYGLIFKQAGLSIYHPHDQEAFVALENLVIDVGRESGAKKTSRLRQNRLKKITVERHTDEQLVAAALYSSMVELSSCSIVTSDSDIQRLLTSTQIYFNEDKDLWPASKMLRENPIKVYFVADRNAAECIVDTSNPVSFRYAYAGREGRKKIRMLTK